MKKLMSILLGLSLVIGTAVIGFAAEPEKKEEVKKEAKKKGKKAKKTEDEKK
jgi:hypothetical protein